jgi:hypothetical protein
VGIGLEAELAEDLPHLVVLARRGGVEPLDVALARVDAEPLQQPVPELAVARQARGPRPQGPQVDDVLLGAATAAHGLDDPATAAVLVDHGGHIAAVAPQHTAQSEPDGAVGLGEQPPCVEHYLASRLPSQRPDIDRRD